MDLTMIIISSEKRYEKRLKDKNFPVPIEKDVIKIGKNGETITKTISYKLQIIDSATFMISCLSNLDSKSRWWNS